LLDPPVAIEVDGLRRALGDTSLGAIVPHVTLVPPVNVRTADLFQAVDVLRRAAGAQRGALELQIGPVATFSPESPVVYLAVSGPGLAGLGRLHEAVCAGPLSRPTRWPWVPHVTLSDATGEERIAAALVALGSYTASVRVDRVVLLEEHSRRWSPVADACLGEPSVVCRGGLEVEITRGQLVGPDALGMVEAQEEARGDLFVAAGTAGTGGAPGAQREANIVLTARRDGRVAGLGVAWTEHGGGPVHVCILVEAGLRRQGIGRALVLAMEPELRSRGFVAVRGHGPSGFFASCSTWSTGPGSRT
jgi:2'-5' RNA ligase